jgi:hypothetical protein
MFSRYTLDVYLFLIQSKTRFFHEGEKQMGYLSRFQEPIGTIEIESPVQTDAFEATVPTGHTTDPPEWFERQAPADTSSVAAEPATPYESFGTLRGSAEAVVSHRTLYDFLDEIEGGELGKGD